MNVKIKNHVWIVILVSIIGCDVEKYTDFTLTKFHYIKKDYDEYIINRDLGFHRLSGYQIACLLYTSPSPRDLSTSRMPSSA